jgi:DNA repair protein RadD
VFTPRPYQQDAHDAIIDHARKSLESQVCVIPTGGGKTHIIASIAKTLHDMTGKRILITAPNADLVTENAAKYKAYGYKASIFCASAGSKSLRHDVVFGSPLSLLNASDRLEGFGVVILDECDLITETVKKLIENLREKNPNLRVIGVTATPYRLSRGMGYIYESHYKNGFVDETYRPYFKKCVYEAYARDLLESGYLTKPLLGKKELHYETDNLVINKFGKIDAHSIDETFIGKGRLTSDIVKDVVETCTNYRGVMFFASTIQHAEEIMESLPPEKSGIVHSKLDAKTRRKTMLDAKNQRIKYIVNVDCLTVGIDWPHIDCIAMLRRTESARLYQQIIGRGLRLYEGKPHCLILDYAGNNSEHFPDGDIFNPKIRAKASTESETISAICPECSHENQFALRPNDAGYTITENGYFSWPDTQDIVLDSEKRPVPAHFGRRCKGLVNRVDRCNYKWSFKKCESCEHENDISARYCAECKAEIIDPNEKLELEKIAKQKAIDEKHITEKIRSRTIEEQWNGDKRVKVITFLTVKHKRIKQFLRVSDEKQRETYRYYRNNLMLCESVYITFYPLSGKNNSKYYKFVGISMINNLQLP